MSWRIIHFDDIYGSFSVLRFSHLSRMPREHSSRGNHRARTPGNKHARHRKRKAASDEADSVDNALQQGTAAGSRHRVFMPRGPTKHLHPKQALYLAESTPAVTMQYLSNVFFECDRNN